MARPFKPSRTSNAAHHEDNAQLVYVSHQSGNGNFLDLSGLNGKLQELLQKNSESSSTTTQQPNPTIEAPVKSLVPEANSTVDQIPEEIKDIEINLGVHLGESAPITTQEPEGVIEYPTTKLLKFIQSTRLRLQLRLQKKDPNQNNVPDQNEVAPIDTDNELPVGTVNISDPAIALSPIKHEHPLPPHIDMKLEHTDIPSYSPTNYSTSLQAILADKTLNKVVIPLSDKDSKKRRSKPSTQSIANHLKEFVDLDGKRYPLLTQDIFHDLEEYESQGLLPDSHLNLGFDCELPLPAQQYIRCMIYFLTVHPRLRQIHPFPLTPLQLRAYNKIYDIFCNKKYMVITKRLETRLLKIEHLFYKGTVNRTGENSKYAENWTGKITERKYKQMIPGFLKELIVADILNGEKTKKSGKQWFVASDWDDKENGFDLVCIDLEAQKIGIVDMTTNPNWVARKLKKMDEFVKENRFINTDFNTYLSNHKKIDEINLHSSVLYVDSNKFLHIFLTYISKITEGDYGIGKITNKIFKYPVARERKHSFGNIKDKEFFAQK